MSESKKKKLDLTDDEWRERLTAAQYHVLRRKGTEPAFTGSLLHEKEKGTYVCAGCEAELFGSEAKFDSGSGWPSFWKPIDEDRIEEEEDRRLLMSRTEVKCARCGSHLGHVFDDGPEPTGLRYCVNSVALEFRRKEE